MRTTLALLGCALSGCVLMGVAHAQTGDELAEPPTRETEEANPPEAAAEPEAELAVGNPCSSSLRVAGVDYQICGQAVVATREGRVVAVRTLDVTPSELFERSGTVWFAIGDRAAALETYQPTPPAPPTHRPPIGEPEPERPAFDGPTDLDPHGRYVDRLAPERTSGIQLGLTITPVIGGGIGLMGDAFVAWRAKRAFSARLVVDRIGHTFSADNAPEFGVIEGNLLLGYDHRYFELAMGVGTARARIDDFDRRLNGMALTIAASMRFGALDGLHVQGSTTIITGEDNSQTSKIAVQLQWPMMAGKWFIMRGAGSGPAGYAWGEIGMRILARGQRGRGSLFISPALGGGGMRNDFNFGSVYGFTMSIGIEYRP